jgi:Tol biopolymer transport system component/predicted Ser/Thr protein kinase
MMLHYRVVEKIGEGGMGVVWKAVDTTLDREVAIKVLTETVAAAHDAELLARFEREAKLLGSLDHPNIATIYGLFESDGTRFVAMEYIPGENLAERLARGSLNVDDALTTAQHIAEALEVAHESGVVHRDLKPANVKLTPDGKVKVLDFGLAKAFAADAKSASGMPASPSLSPTVTSADTVAGVILGTAGYMSPEQAKGKPVDRRADIWAFGVLLAEMLSGVKRFDGETVSETLAQVLMKEVELDDLPGVTPAPVRRLLGRCLERDPRRRLRDIGEARVLLEDVNAGTVDAEENVAAAGETPARTSRLAWSVAAVFALVAIAAGLLALRPTQTTPPSRAAIRFEVPPPEGTLLRTMYETAAPPVISPDGRAVVFGVMDTDRVNRLWLRPLDGPARPLPGTDGGTRPFWSPDSRSIGFFTTGELRRIDLAGGPALAICPSQNARGGTWNADDEILFSPDAAVGLYRVAATGGEPVSVTELGTSPPESSHRYPHFLPNGRHFLYLALAEAGAYGTAAESDLRVMLSSLDGDTPRLLLRGASNTVYAAGHLVFRRGEGLQARPFDPERLEFTGEQRALVESVHYDAGYERAVFSASDDVLAYVGGAFSGQTQLRLLDRAGKTLRIIEEGVEQINPRFSPDGRRVAISMFDSQGEFVWVYDLERGVRSRLTFDEGLQGFPVWSPDGTRVAYAWNEGSGWGTAVRRTDGEGDREILVDDSLNVVPYAWSRDGRYLVLTGYGGGSSDLWVLESDEDPRPLIDVPHNVSLPSLSPDGNWLSYTSDESGRMEVYVTRFPSARGRWLVSNEGGLESLWHPDGRSLYYRSLSHTVMQVPLSFSGSGGKNLEIEPPFKLFDLISSLDSEEGVYDLAPDGKTFVTNVISEEHMSAPVTVVVDWTSTLSR